MTDGVLRLSDAQWGRIREHFPEQPIPSERRGRKPIPARKLLEAVLRILDTGPGGAAHAAAVLPEP